MSPDEVSSEYNKTFIFTSSESSDSESFLQEDLESSESFINKQWEAIERTLYQESGQQVTDPELLKECKLWRETFPHFRVKGTRLDLNQPKNEVQEIDKDVQTLSKHFDLKKLEEKRENIKKKVVGGLVERLITKYSLGKEGNASAEIKKSFRNGVQKNEILDEISEKLSNFSTKPNPNKPVPRNLKTSSALNMDKESYFERGKETNMESIQEESYFNIADAEKNLNEIFDSWEKDCKIATKLPKSLDYKKGITPSKRDSIPEKNSNKQIPERLKGRKCAPSNSLSYLSKPFEMTKKIDKKYEGLIEKIVERKCNEFDIIQHCHTSASGLNINTCQESLEKIKKGSGFDDYLRRKEIPKINKLNNNWLNRSEMNFYDEEDEFISRSMQSIKSFAKPTEDNNQDDIDERLLEELKKQMALNTKRPGKKVRAFEEINTQRPKPFMPAVTKTSKSSSCRDLTMKNKKEMKDKLQRSGPETGKSESNLKNNLKFKSLNGNKRCKSNAIQNSLLPPIETGIICTELTGRPKVAPKKPIKRN